MYVSCRAAVGLFIDVLADIASAYVKSSNSSYENDEIHNIQADTDFAIWYRYIETDVSMNDMSNIYTRGHIKSFGDEVNKEHKRKQQYLGEILSRNAPWQYCHTKRKCYFPVQLRKCDVVLLCEVVVKGITWRLPIFLCECESAGAAGVKGFGQLAVEVGHALAVFPTVFGMIVNKDDISLYEFTRNPEESRINVSKQVIPLTGKRKGGIGADFASVADLLLKCTLYTWIYDLNRIKEGLIELHEKGHRCAVNGPKSKVHNTCFYIRNVGDLNSMIGKTYQPKRKPNKEKS